MQKVPPLHPLEQQLDPTREWAPGVEGWAVVQVVSGAGYWQANSHYRELNLGDALFLKEPAPGTLRASRVAGMSVRWFWFEPEALGGVLTLPEVKALSHSARSEPGSEVRFFGPQDEVGCLLASLWQIDPESPLRQRSRMLELISVALATELAQAQRKPEAEGAEERLKRWLAQNPQVGLVERSPGDFARELGCSPRHLSRLFRAVTGTSFRERQTELRLQKARRLLAETSEKVVHVALESGYSHLGLFNALFRRRFGMTPSAWRNQKQSSRSVRRSRRISPAGSPLLLALVIGLGLGVGGLIPALQAQTQTSDPKPGAPAAPGTSGATNAAAASPVFVVDTYTITGNTLLSEEVLAKAWAPFTGPTIDLPAIRKAVAEVQSAYRVRGYATVAVTLPPQRVTNGVVKLQVTEAPVTQVEITGNHWFSTANVRRALPDLHTNEVLNSKVFQAGLDAANANRDRQIFPQIGPGPEPGTSGLILKVKDQFPLHGRVEVNNQATPGTPDIRINSSIKYDNLWQYEHSIGFQYGFAPGLFKDGPVNFYDRPAIANYGVYYRMPTEQAPALAPVVAGDPQRFGYDESSHQFRLPAAGGRSELTVFANRSTTDTGVKLSPLTEVNPPPFALYSQPSGQDLSTTEGVGVRWSKPLPEWAGVRSGLSIGADVKHLHRFSYNTNNFRQDITRTNQDTGEVIHTVTPFSTPAPVRSARATYAPISLRWDGGIADKNGTFTFGVGLNGNVAGGPFSDRRSFTNTASSHEASGNFVTAQMSLGREQKLPRDWSILLKADGQWANEPLISNEQLGLGGLGGVRGYREGEFFCDNGIRLMTELRTPSRAVAQWGKNYPVLVRAVAFVDAGGGEILATHRTETLLGSGFGCTGSIGSNFDFRFGVAWALRPSGISSAGDVRMYFSVGAQF